MEMKRLSPIEHPAGTILTLKTIDDMTIEGEILEYTSDAFLLQLKGKDHIAKLHPHEISHVVE